MRRLFGTIALVAIGCTKPAEIPISQIEVYKEGNQDEKKVFGTCIIEKNRVSYMRNGFFNSVPLFLNNEFVMDANCDEKIIIITNRNLLVYGEKKECHEKVCLEYRIFAQDISEIYKLGLINWTNSDKYVYFLTKAKILAVADIKKEKIFAFKSPEIEIDSKIAYFEEIVFISNKNEIVANKVTEEKCQSLSFEINEFGFEPNFKIKKEGLYFGDGFVGYLFNIKNGKIEMSYFLNDAG